MKTTIFILSIISALVMLLSIAYTAYSQISFIKNFISSRNDRIWFYSFVIIWTFILRFFVLNSISCAYCVDLSQFRDNGGTEEDNKPRVDLYATVAMIDSKMQFQEIKGPLAIRTYEPLWGFCEDIEEAAKSCTIPKELDIDKGSDLNPFDPYFRPNRHVGHSGVHDPQHDDRFHGFTISGPTFYLRAPVADHKDGQKLVEIFKNKNTFIWKYPFPKTQFPLLKNKKVRRELNFQNVPNDL